jgi:hypothetical protein
VCYYLTESCKAGADERFADDPVFAECKRLLPEVSVKWPAIGRAVEVSAGKPSRKDRKPPQKAVAGVTGRGGGLHATPEPSIAGT